MMHCLVSALETKNCLTAEVRRLCCNRLSWLLALAGALPPDFVWGVPPNAWSQVGGGKNGDMAGEGISGMDEN